ncbi:LacI family DNA-binding transcriptional regulator [Burkholderia sp. PAMC 26561]|uniref:LacI family DNA-binding transcriptional regulator n=1 Tax=Burkholderia sp. PAMC 26561 TaxID=1795043 RepID=UPI00076B5100|nr:LacI family DNA-binding transcriptional regulator [Burkholderia sp. PAMC 26561]AME23717.1 LacI family transcriptional regulator [Burkholderia sp. PAMC 26561]
MAVKRVTISDVAKATGVSAGAISRILNNDPSLNVREETKNHVREMITKLGYSPNPQARGLRMSRSGTIAMIVPEINSPAFPAIILGAQAAAGERSYSMLLGGIGEEGEDPTLAARILERNRVDGFLVSTGRREKEQFAAVKKLNAPVVLVNRYADDSVPHVILDDEGGVRAMVRYLFDLGHRRIGFLGGTLRFLGSRRLKGYKRALEELGVPFDGSLVVDAGYDRLGGEKAASKLLDLPQRPTAFFSTNQLVAAGAMHEAHRRGYAVPDDLSVASLYDGPVAELLNPTVTSVFYPLDRLGYEAVSMLVALLTGQSTGDISLTIQHENIMERQSTGPVR